MPSWVGINIWPWGMKSVFIWSLLHIPFFHFACFQYHHVELNVSVVCNIYGSEIWRISIKHALLMQSTNVFCFFLNFNIYQQQFINSNTYFNQLLYSMLILVAYSIKVIISKGLHFLLHTVLSKWFHFFIPTQILTLTQSHWNTHTHTRIGTGNTVIPAWAKVNHS